MATHEDIIARLNLDCERVRQQIKELKKRLEDNERHIKEFENGELARTTE